MTYDHDYDHFYQRKDLYLFLKMVIVIVNGHSQGNRIKL